jgi:hypothetical protein
MRYQVFTGRSGCARAVPTRHGIFSYVSPAPGGQSNNQEQLKREDRKSEIDDD